MPPSARSSPFFFLSTFYFVAMPGAAPKRAQVTVIQKEKRTLWCASHHQEVFSSFFFTRSTEGKQTDAAPGVAQFDRVAVLFL